ncbi:hydroxyacylglutathione hydrolase GloC [Alistipes sp.]|jgi:glyoxylase-like metal-dependent hydrolase (beta-lactamase superfamily II)|nr:hydroxyacylglutathione hydrolase GloC [Alistipes sp.]
MMNIARLVFNPLQENTYILWDATKECVIVDPGNFSAREDRMLESFVEERGLRPVLLAATHGHFDHTMGAAFVVGRYGIPFACSAKDRFLIDNAAASAGIFGVKTGDIPAPDLDLDTMRDIRFGQTTLDIIPTPGHTPGHVSLHEPQQGILLTGDTLFRESIGRTDLPGGDYSWIMRSILERLLPLGDGTKVYPGHGEETDLGHESLYNPFVTEVLNNEINYKG